jgi:hypothetical protein
MPPAAPQMVSAIKQSPSGALVTWLEPDNGGAPITGYNVYRGITSGGEAFLAHVDGVTTTKYFDPSPPTTGSVFYYAQAINTIPAEGPHCREVSLSLGNPETECVPPGLSKLSDPAGDTSAALGIVSTPAPPGSDLLKFQISQPYQVDNIPRLIFTITTDNGQSPQPTGSAWYVAFKIGANYKGVHMAWKPTSPTTPIFESYTPGANNSGGVDGRFVNPGSEIAAEATSNYLPPYNQVIIVVKASDLGLNPGDTISGFVSGVSQSTDPGSMVGAGATALYDEMPNGLGYTGTYTVDNNQVCRPNLAPIPFMTATPMSGTAPLTVNFNASGSSDPDTAAPADTIASYTLDFGDGSAPVTHASPLFSHTYYSNGDFPARLTVTDSRGKPSTSDFQLVISVASTLTATDSRKMHGTIGSFDVPLPLTVPAGVECRTGGQNGNYTIIYTFNPTRTITAVDNATVSQGTASILSRALGPNSNQYTVTLTGVANAQHLKVKLDGVHDNAGANLVNVIALMDVLLGDTTGNRAVNSSDISQTQSQSGQPLTGGPSGNFREDVTVNGLINSSDISLVQSQSGSALP